MNFSLVRKIPSQNFSSTGFPQRLLQFADQLLINLRLILHYRTNQLYLNNSLHYFHLSISQIS